MPRLNFSRLVKVDHQAAKFNIQFIASDGVKACPGCCKVLPPPASAEATSATSKPALATILRQNFPIFEPP
jgi:hypothetical protein